MARRLFNNKLVMLTLAVVALSLSSAFVPQAGHLAAAATYSTVGETPITTSRPSRTVTSESHVSRGEMQEITKSIDFSLVPITPSGAPLRPASSTQGNERAVMQYSPAKCRGITDYPHSSDGVRATTNGPYVSVHGRTTCQYNAGGLSAQAGVWKKVWHGNELKLTGNLATAKNSYQTYDSTPHYYCKGQGNASWVGITNHVSVEGGVTYTLRTVNEGTPSKSTFKC